MSETPRTMLDRAREALNARLLKDDLRLVLENVITYAAEQQAENERLRVELDQAHDNLIGANLSLYEEEQETARLRLALASAQRGRRELRAQVAALLEERHRTNEWADDAAKALRADRDRIVELEARLAEYERPADEDPIAFALTEQAVSVELPPATVRCGCGHPGSEHHHVGAKCWARLPRELGQPVRICPCAAFAPVSVDESADRLARYMAPTEGAE